MKQAERTIFSTIIRKSHWTWDGHLVTRMLITGLLVAICRPNDYNLSKTITRIQITGMLAALLLPCWLSATVPVGSTARHADNEVMMVVPDRDVYVAGEQVFYRLYHAINGSSFDLSGFSYVVLQNNDGDNMLMLTNHFAAGNKYGSFYLPDTLQSGIYVITAYTDAMRRAASNVFHGRKILVLNRFDEEDGGDGFVLEGDDDRDPGMALGALATDDLRVITHKEKLGRRELVRLTLEGADDMHDLTVSVAWVASFLPELSGFSAFQSNSQPHDNRQTFPRERDKYFLNGRLVDLASGQGVAGKHIMLSRPDSVLTLIYAKTGENGQFMFELPPYYFNHEVYLHPFEDSFGENVQIIMEDKWQILPYKPEEPITLRAEKAEYFDILRRAVGVAKAYPAVSTSAAMAEPAHVDGTEPKIFAKPSYGFELANYEPLENLQEIARELIPQLRIRKQDDVFSVRIMNDDLSYTFFDNPPRIFLDGVPIHDVNAVAGLGSSQLTRVEVVTVPWRYGDLEFEGVLSLFSNQQASLLADHATPIRKISLPAVLSSQAFAHPSHEENKDYPAWVPDYRHTLYWNPQLTVEKGEPAELQFFTGDLPGTYAIRVRGVNANGEVKEHIGFFEVEL